MTLPTHINPSELAAIREVALKAELLKVQATSAAKDLETIQLRAFLRYGLSEADSIDIQTGAISRSTPAPAPPVEAPAPAPGATDEPEMHPRDVAPAPTSKTKRRAKREHRTSRLDAMRWPPYKEEDDDGTSIHPR